MSEQGSYKALMNYIHNELGITKEDIKLWTREAISEIAQNYVDHQMSQTTFEDAIMRAVVDSQDKKHSWWGRKEITSDIKREVASIIASGLKIEITGGDHE